MVFHSHRHEQELALFRQVKSGLEASFLAPQRLSVSPYCTEQWQQEIMVTSGMETSTQTKKLKPVRAGPKPTHVLEKTRSRNKPMEA